MVGTVAWMLAELPGTGNSGNRWFTGLYCLEGCLARDSGLSGEISNLGIYGVMVIALIKFSVNATTKRAILGERVLVATNPHCLRLNLTYLFPINPSIVPPYHQVCV
jgi:hypothetical protein